LGSQGKLNWNVFPGRISMSYSNLLLTIFFCYNFVTMATREKNEQFGVWLVQQLAQWCVKTAVLIWMAKTPGERVSER
jgi:hypothetical protein